MRRYAVMLGVAFVFACGGPGGPASARTVQAISETAGMPVAGVQVQLNDGPWIATDSEGFAAVGELNKPFTIRVLQKVSDAYKVSHTFWQRVNPPLTPDGVFVVAVPVPTQVKRFSELSGTVTGHTGTGQVQVLAQSMNGFASAGANATSGAFQFTNHLQWEGPPTREIEVHVLETNSASPPTAFLSYGASSVALTVPEGSSTGAASAAIAVSAITTARVTGTVSPRTTDLDWATRQSLRFSRSELQIGYTSRSQSTPATYDFVFPVVPNAQAWIVADTFTANVGGGSHSRRIDLTGATSGIDFDIPKRFALVSPAANASGPLASTTFAWEPHEEPGTYQFYLGCSWGGSGTTHELVMREVDVPDASTVAPSVPGIAIPSGSYCSWDARWYSLANTDSDIRIARSSTGLRRFTPQ